MALSTYGAQIGDVVNAINALVATAPNGQATLNIVYAPVTAKIYALGSYGVLAGTTNFDPTTLFVAGTDSQGRPITASQVTVTAPNPAIDFTAVGSTGTYTFTYTDANGTTATAQSKVTILKKGDTWVNQVTQYTKDGAPYGKVETIYLYEGQNLSFKAPISIPAGYEISFKNSTFHAVDPVTGQQENESLSDFFGGVDKYDPQLLASFLTGMDGTVVTKDMTSKGLNISLTYAFVPVNSVLTTTAATVVPVGTTVNKGFGIVTATDSTKNPIDFNNPSLAMTTSLDTSKPGNGTITYTWTDTNTGQILTAKVNVKVVDAKIGDTTITFGDKVVGPKVPVVTVDNKTYSLPYEDFGPNDQTNDVYPQLQNVGTYDLHLNAKGLADLATLLGVDAPFTPASVTQLGKLTINKFVVNNVDGTTTVDYDGTGHDSTGLTVTFAPGLPESKTASLNVSDVTLTNGPAIKVGIYTVSGLNADGLKAVQDALGSNYDTSKMTVSGSVTVNGSQMSISQSGSTSLSESQSGSTSLSQSQSGSTSLSESQSGSTSLSESQSGSISLSESQSGSTSLSESQSGSTSLSESQSGSTSL
ncbi:MBG domain-containing protein, partial [Furfurilactobacillus siliginis]